MLLFSLFGGAVADRFAKKRIIQASQAMAAGLALFIAISISTGTVTWTHLFIVSILHGVIYAFMVPARTALIPYIVGKDLTTNALALNAGALSATTLIAPAIAGNLYNLLGPDGVYYFLAGLDVIGVILTGCIGKIDEHLASSTSKKMLSEIAAGLKHIWERPVVVAILVLSLSTALFSFPFMQLVPVYVVDIYQRGPEALGLLVSIAGVGAVLGSLAMAARGRSNRGLILLSGGLLGGVALLFAAFLPFYAIGAIAMGFLGLGNAIRRSLSQAMMLELVDEEYRGRVSSVYVMNFGLMPLGVLPASAIAEYFGARTAATVLGFCLIAICLTMLLTQKRLRRMD
jgi:MFS family permease